MQDNSFKEWLTAEGFAASTIATRLTDARRVEKQFGDLDSAFAQDECAAIMRALTYTAADRAAGKRNMSGIEIDGDIYDGLASYKSALGTYLRFLSVPLPPKNQSQADRIRQHVAQHYANQARTEGRAQFIVIAGDVHREMGLSNAMPAICSALDSRIFAELVQAKLIDRQGPANSSTVSFTFDFDSSGPFNVRVAEQELRWRYGEPISSIKPDGNKKITSFALPSERQIALELEGQSVRLWVEDPQDAPPPPCEQVVSYLPEQGRQTNLPSRLKHNPPGGVPARRVMKLTIPNYPTLTAVLDWYDAIYEEDMQLTREAVIQAMDECDRLSLDDFLNVHGFGAPSTYWLAERDKLYPSKAIANVGLRNILGKSADIVDATRSKQMLERLGFRVIDRNAAGSIKEPKPAVERQPEAAKPTNLILYGPPGTGKTYHSAYEAVRLCDGFADANDRTALKARYDSLVEAGQIAFVTFHQSYAYEDFVEGLRPETGTDGEEGGATGFRLEPRRGIFREISALAEQARRHVGRADGFDLTGRQFFKMSLGRAGIEDHIFDAAIEGNYIVLGWGGEVDWSDPRFDDYQAIHDKWNEIAPGTSGNSSNISQVWRFRSSMREGDIVIVSEGNSRFRAIGEIMGPYEYNPTDRARAVR